MPRQTGRLMAKTQRQSNVVNSPPSGGPTRPATAPPTAQTPRALARRRVGERLTDQRHRGRQHDRRPAPWAHRAATSAAVVGANAHAADVSPEQGDAEGQRRLGADPVRQVAGEQQQRGEHQGVAVDHPLLPGGAAAQLGPDLGQRDVHDRDVQRDQEEPHRGDRDHDLGMRSVGYADGRMGRSAPGAD